MDLHEYLGADSYPVKVEKIKQKIAGTNVNSLRGQQLILELNENLQKYQDLPMMQIKAFQTNAEEVSREDVALMDLLKFIDKSHKSGDFNYLINLAKEEHIANERRAGVPSPEKSLQEFEHLFNEKSNVVVDAIKKGMFDGLNSQLYNDLKTDLTNSPSIAPETGLKKSKNPIRKTKLGNINTLYESYQPLAVKYVQPEQDIYLTEFGNMIPETVDNVTVWKSVKNVSLPPTYSALNIAVKNANFDSDTDEIKLVHDSVEDNWDFDIKIKPDGNVYLNDEIQVNLKDLGGLFSETIALEPDKNVRDVMLIDADRFILLANNYNILTKLDEINVIKNDKFYIVVDNNSTKPELIASKNGVLQFKSFREMVNQLNNEFGFESKSLFESQLNNETEIINQRQKDAEQLKQSQDDLNTLIKNTMVIRDAAEMGSPARLKADKELQKLNESLEDNFEKLTNLQNTPLY